MVVWRPIVKVTFTLDETTVEAELAAELYKRLKRARGREAELAMASCAVTNGASLWSLNPEDFHDIPRLQLARG